MKQGTVKAITFGFFVGVLIRSLIHVSLPLILLISLLALSLFIFVLVISKKRKVLYLFFLFMCCLSLGMVRFHLADRDIRTLELHRFIGKPATLVGIIVDDPDERENNIKLHVEVTKINDKTLNNGDVILATIERYNELAYGDEIKLSGIISTPANFTSDLGKEFDYISYLKKDGIYFEMKSPETEAIATKKGNFVKKNLLLFKSFVEEKFSHYIREPEAGLMNGILLGSKQSLGSEWRDRFIQTGTIHIIALSGYNVTIVAEWLMDFFGLLMATTISVWVGIAGIVFFAIMTGGSSTVIRASIMAILVLLARILGRDYDIGRALLLAAFGMILINPWILVFDVSFELSFLATIGIVYLAPKVEKWFYFLTKKFKLRELVSATVATNIFVLPFIVYKMGIFSLVALPANILILPLIPATMLLGMLLVVMSFIPIAATLLGALSYGLLHTELSVIKFFASLSFASVSIPHMSLLVVIISYVGLLYWIFGRNPQAVDIKVQSIYNKNR